MDCDKCEKGIVGKRLQGLMIARNIDPLSLSAEIKLPRATIDHIIDGTTIFPRADTVLTLAKYFSVPMEFLLGQDSNATNAIQQETKENIIIKEAGKIPILSFDQIKQWLNYADAFDSRKDIKWMQWEKLKEKSFAVRVPSGFIPIAFKDAPFQKDNILVIEPQEKYKPQDILMVSFLKLKPTIRQIVEDGGICYLMPIAGQFKIEAFDDQVTVFGKIIAVIKLID